MNTSRQITDSDLNAYLDGELDERGREEVERWLAEHPDDAARMQAYRHHRDELHRLFDPVLDEPVPPAIRARVLSRGRGVVWGLALRAAAAVLLLALGALGGWSLRGLDGGAPLTAGQPTAAGQPPTAGEQAGTPRAMPAGGSPAFVTHAVDAHVVYAVEVRHPVEVGAKEEAHLTAWLSKRLGHKLRVPVLHKAGFNLVGGRLLPDEGQPAAQFMFEDRAGRRATLYLRRYEGPETAFRYLSGQEAGGAGRASAFYWIDSPLAYALTADMPREELLSVARLAYEDITRR